MTADGPRAGDLPVVEPPFEREGGATGSTDSPPRVAGVLLAAGTSSRYGGRNKLLEPVDGEPMVRRAARTLLVAGLDPVVVVLGHEADRVREVLADPADGLGGGLDFVENPDYADGQATSVAVGVAALPEEVDAAVFALGDMPWVRPETVERLVDAHRSGVGTALAAAFEGERGNPVLWDARHFESLAGQSGDVGGRDLLLSTSGAALVETGDPGVRRDVDRPGDL